MANKHAGHSIYFIRPLGRLLVSQAVNTNTGCWLLLIPPQYQPRALTWSVHRCTFYIKSKLHIRNIAHDGGEWCALYRCVMQATGDLDSGPALRILCYSHRSVTSLIPTLYTLYLQWTVELETKAI